MLLGTIAWFLANKAGFCKVDMVIGLGGAFISVHVIVA
jgi:hypothetical protein